jgi:hypothetical protein
LKHHGDYPDAVRAVAAETKVPLLEMNRLTMALEESHGAEGSKRLHLWIAAGVYERQPDGYEDNTHYSRNTERIALRHLRFRKSSASVFPCPTGFVEAKCYFETRNAFQACIQPEDPRYGPALFDRGTVDVYASNTFPWRSSPHFNSSDPLAS